MSREPIGGTCLESPPPGTVQGGSSSDELATYSHQAVDVGAHPEAPDQLLLGHAHRQYREAHAGQAGCEVSRDRTDRKGT